MKANEIHKSLHDMFEGQPPVAVNLAYELDETILEDTYHSRSMSIGHDKNPFDPKTSRLLFLASALSRGDSECVEAQTKLALKSGATKQEIIWVMKIVRHATFNGVLGNFTPALEILSKGDK